jgi:hypothetical protein
MKKHDLARYSDAQLVAFAYGVGKQVTMPEQSSFAVAGKVLGAGGLMIEIILELIDRLMKAKVGDKQFFEDAKAAIAAIDSIPKA